MRLFIKIFIFLFIPFGLSAQGEYDNWYFGYNAGLNFSSGDPIPINDSEIDAQEGCASISDAVGNLLFYTNGQKIWNEENQIMPNGDDLLGHFSSCQSSLIVRLPNSDYKYYVFTTTQFIDFIGLKYSIVDMSLDSNRGDVTGIKNVFVVDSLDEKLTAVQLDDQNAFWIITKKVDERKYYAYFLNQYGLNAVPVVSDFNQFESNHQGYLKASPNGNLLMSCQGNTTTLYKFNKETGVLSNQVEFDSNSHFLYAEFSPNSQLLYAGYKVVGEPLKIGQFDLANYNEFDINSSLQTIYTSTYISNVPLGAMQIGPDQKIYIARIGLPFLDRINEPNIIGQGCNYNINAITLNTGTSQHGLPNAFSSDYKAWDIKADNLCLPDSTLFEYQLDDYDSIFWDLGDVISGMDNYSSLDSFYHQYSDTGFYNIQLIKYLDNEVDTINYYLNIYQPYPFDLGSNQQFCEDETIILDPFIYGAEYLWQDSSNNQQFYVEKPGGFWLEITKNGCISSDSLLIEYCDPLIIMPNIFSPNNDGVNDTFIPIDYGDVYQFSIQIYNRWGSLVFSSDKIEDFWDGEKDGDECSDGVYFWIANYAGASGQINESKGTVTLVR